MTWGVQGASVSFGANKALDTVDLKIEPGDIAVIVGGDGAGKTTLSRVLVGLEELDAGSVSRPKVTGFQPETSGVWHDMTVFENLRFVAGAYGLSEGHARERIHELLAVTSLDIATNRLGGQLSGGMRQKLGVAMAVLSEPELLVLDEPTTGLDPVSRLELWDFITRSAREGRGVVVTTTYVDEASRGSSVLTLDEGSVLAAGSVADVIGSMPGRIYEVPVKESNAWRRGHSWRVWTEDTYEPVTGSEVVPDLADVVTVAALRREVSS